MSVSRVCGRCAHLCRAACPRSPTTLPPACRRTIGLLPPLPPSFRHLGHAPAVGLWTSDILPSFTCRAVAPFAAAFSPPSPCPCRRSVDVRRPAIFRLPGCCPLCRRLFTTFAMPLPSVCGRPTSCHLSLVGLLLPLPPPFHHLRHAPAVGLWTSAVLPSSACRAVAPFAAVFSPPSPCPCRGAVISRAPSGCRLAFARAVFPAALPPRSPVYPGLFFPARPPAGRKPFPDVVYLVEKCPSIAAVQPFLLYL